MKLKQVWRNYRFLILISSLVVLLDQLSKAYIRSNFQEGVDMWAPWPWMIQYARIIHISNTGIAFGLFQGMGNIFTILYVVVVIGIVYYFMSVPMEDWLLRLALALLLGGALGNLVDRLTQGYVTDFISVGNFPVFNIADSGITLGVIALAIGVWMQERREKLAADALEGEPSAKADSSEILGDGDQATKDSHLS